MDIELRLAQHLLDQPRQDLDMSPRSNLRHHTAIGPVRGILPDHRLGEDLPIAGHQRRRGVVARGLEA
jgi:hypothetical protein